MVTDVETGTVKWASRSIGSLLTGPDQRASSRDTVTPKDGVDSVAAEDIAVVRAADREAASLPEGESVSIRYRVRAADGSLRWLSRRTTPFRHGPAGSAAEVLSVVREVTDVSKPSALSSVQLYKIR